MSHQHNKRSLIGFFFSKISNEQDNYEVKRENMVKIQLMERGISDPDTLRAMRQVERHEFVPEKMKKGAYSDSPMSIGHYQTISQPYIVGYMTQALKLKPEHRVLEIGTGSGYQAAVLATIVASVYTIEIVEPLGIVAKKRFQDLGYNNIRSTIGDGYHGWPDEAPFNAIIVTAAVKKIPTALIDQLAEGGRMIIPVRHSDLRYYLVLVTKKNGEISYKKLIPVAFVPFTRNTD